MKRTSLRGASRWGTTAILACTLVAFGQLHAQGPEPARGVNFPAISQVELKEWLTYLSSDELEGRQVFTEGYGIATQFIAERLREWGVQPLGDHGSYFQIVKLQSYQVTRRSSVTVVANGQTRTFADGDHVSFPLTGGGRQTLSFETLEIAGVDGQAGSSGRSIAGRLMAVVDAAVPGRIRRGADAALLRTAGAAAAIEYRPTLPEPSRGEREGRGGTAATQADIPETTARVDAVTPPHLLADAEFFSTLMASAPGGFASVRERLARGEALSSAALAGLHVTIHVDNTYEPITTRFTRNVVGKVEGADPILRDTYVLFGAHLDHVGYATSNRDTRGRTNVPIASDRIWNGADDDGTGSTAELALAKAFATGPRPKRSVVFIWHAGEEAELYGSRFNADFPIVPLENVQCFLNIDMIGRNRNDDPSQQNTLFVIGADRISSDLHELIISTNATLPAPLTLSYEYNDPLDVNSFYTRSDHFSYASKGIPIAFFFTGEHADYHANTDSVDKILFDKQARIAQLVYETGFAVADAERALRRDNQGPRVARPQDGSNR
jgi:hypothetical protein